ncbi:MAG: PKD domain-containing protein [Cyclobacteriaceae bacterium]|nr:PKD domain-containing protein [Cyclobacteriaceae bacterium]
MPALYRIAFLCLAFFGAFSAFSQAPVTITPASTVGGVPLCVGGSPVSLTSIVISETSTGGGLDDDAIGGGHGNFPNVTLTFGIPAAFQFVPGMGTVISTPGGDDVVINSFTISANTISINFSAFNDVGTDKFDAIIISGLQVRAVSGTGQTVNITRTGGTGVITGLPNGTVVGTVTSVLPPAPVITGNNSVCANEQNVVYSTPLVASNNYSWIVSGGTIVGSSTNNTVTVNWGASGTGFLRVTQTNTTTGCATTTADYNVTINANPTPAIGGNNSVCANQTGVVYSTPVAAGRTYTWTVTGGTITAGQGTNSITVTWGVAGLGTVQLEEIINATTCTTTTPLYNVTINTNPAPVISGSATACANDLGVVYNTGATGNNFNWTVNGGTITTGQGTNSITVTWGTAGTGTVRVTETIPATGCATTTADYNVTINPNPTPAISGNNSVCTNQTGVVYTTPVAAGRTYTWTVTGGSITTGQGTNSITVTWGVPGVGTVQLQETITATTCTTTTPLYNVTINANPAPVISGPVTACANESGAVYNTGATGNNFNWTVNGGSITAGQGTNNITVTWGAAGTGSVRVTETIPSTGCAATTADYNVTINPNPTPVIIGDNSVCANEQDVTYMVPFNAGRTYSWTVTGGTIDGPSNGNSIVVDWGAAGPGTVAVLETILATGCSTLTPDFNIVINNSPSPAISGSATVCANTTGEIYSTPHVAGDLYSWSITGGIIVAGAGTNSITVDWGGAGTGSVTVTQFIVSSSCTVTTPPYNVTIEPIPTPSITGDNTVCENAQNKVYSTPLVAGHTYAWVVTGGTIDGPSTGNSITVDWGAAGTGTIQLTETITASGCFITTPVFNVNINTLPTPVISGLDVVCANDAGVVYSTPESPGNTYTWSVSGGSIVSGAGTHSITVNWGPAGAGTIAVTEIVPSSSCITVTPVYPVTINPTPTPVISGDNTVCANEQNVVYTSPFTVGNTYSWNVTGGTIVGSSTNNTVTVDWGVAGPGTLILTETVGGCTSVTPAYNVTINPNPTPVITGNNNVCRMETGVLYSTPNVGGNTYAWTVVGGTIDSGAGTNQISVTWTSAGTGSISVVETITATGCNTLASSVLVTVSPNPLVNAGSDQEICEGSAFSFATQATPATASDYASLLWTTTGTGVLSNETGLTPDYTPGVGETGPVTFTLTAEGIGTCADVADQMILTITPLPVVDAGSNSETCEGVMFNFSTQATPASALNYATLAWSHTGTGTLFNPNTISPTYIPGAGETGTVTFTLLATSAGSCANASDQMELVITPAPTVNAGSDAEICQGSTFDFTTQSLPAYATNFASLLWTTTGTGSLTGANTLTPSYTPGVGETGNVTFALTATGNGSCASVQDDMVLQITPAPTVNAGSDAEICQGTAFNFNTQSTLASVSNFLTIQWTHTGSGTIFNANTLTPTYTPGVGETGNVVFTLTATGNGSCVSVNDQMTLTITPSVLVSAGSDSETCQGVAFNFSTQATPASANNFNTIIWTTSGTGTLTDANTLTPSYTPGIGETGNVTFTLTATGNGSCSSVQDAMVLHITPTPSVDAGSDAEICQGFNYGFVSQTTPASAGNYASLLWTTTGSGSLFNANTLTPTYIPQAGETGAVIFTLTATGNGSCVSVNDQMTLAITPEPTAFAGSDSETCQGITFNFSSQATPASATEFATVLWTHNGTGTLTNANTLTPSYTPGVGETGTVILTLTANGNGSCASVNDQMTLTITPAPIAFAGSDAETCQGVNFAFSTQATPASATNHSSLLWTHSGTGTIFDANTLTPTYQPGVGETGNITFTLTVNGNGSCTSSVDQMVLVVTPAPTANAGSNAETCEGVAFAFSTQAIPASATNYSSILWTTTGTGSLINASTFTPTYTPGVGETGAVTFTLTVNGNGSCASVADQMILNITPAPVVSAGSDSEICQEVTFHFNTQTTLATAINFNTILWTTTGAGLLSNANTLTPTYAPAIGETGVITFTLTATGNGSCVSVNDQMTLVITPEPTAFAGSDSETCQGITFNFSTQATPASATEFATVLWTHNGTGTLTNANTLTPSYTPGVGETGTVILTLTASGNGSCASVNDQMTLTITPAPIAFAGSDAETCQGVNFAFSTQATPASATNHSSLLWTHSGTGTIFDANTLTPTYQPGVGETGNITFTLTVNGNGSCTSSVDQMVLVVTPAPTANAGSNAETCEGVAFAFSTQAIPASATNYSSILWTTTGTGSLINASTFTPTYTPGVGETGAVTFTLTVNGNGSCASVADQMILNITPAPVVSAGSDSEICQEVTFHFNTQTTLATAINFNTILWTTTGAGLLSNANTLTPTYAPAIGETGVITFTLTATGNGSCVSVNDQMTLVITPEPTAFAGSDSETCQGITFNFSTQATPASATEFATVLWTHNGTGTLTNANTLTPSYTPGVGETGTVILTLTASGNGSCASVNDQMTLTITPAPIAFAGSDAETCQGVNFAFSTQATPASATNHSSLLWTHSGTGTIFDANTLTPTYQPGVGETGNITFTLTVNGNGSCTSSVDQMVLVVTPAPTANAGSNAETCEGVAFAFSTQAIPASATNYSSILWTTTGTGSLINASTFTPTYTPGVGETGAVTFTLTVNGNGSCASVADQMILNITPAPVVSAGSDSEICQEVTFHFNTQTTLATAINFNTILWTTTGAGLLSNANTLTPTYAPAIGETGVITFTLTATGNGSCVSVNDQMTLVITPEPTAFAGSDSETCQGITFNFSTQATPASATEFATVLWTHNGTGTLTNANTLTPSYTPGVGETGTVILTLTASGNGSCASVNDQMTLTITPAPIAFAGSDAETCQGVNFAFSTQATPASATNHSSLLWTHSGTGTIFDANTLTPTYQPGVGETGNITFTLTVNGNGSCTSSVDQMVLVVTPAPTANAGSNAETCEGVAFAFSTQAIPASATNYSSILWTTTGTGSLINASTFTPTYTPGVGETGAVTFTLTVNGNGSCASVADQMILNITPAPVVSAGSDSEICQEVTFHFNTQTTLATAINFNTILWTTTGAGLLSNANTLTPTYAPAIGETGVITFTLTATGNGSCVSVNDQMTLVITPEPTAFAGSDSETCQGITFNFSTQATPASATEFATVLWTHNGTGTLTNANTLTPSYTPGVGETGTVILTLTASGNGSCASVNDQMTLTITPAPIAFAGSDAETCQGVNFAFSTQATPASATNHSSLLWTHSGTGTIFDANTLTPTYQPGVGETGNITFTLTATGNGSCVSVNDQMTLTITPAASVFAGSDAETCQGVDFSFAAQSSPATAANFQSILWTTTGTGSIANANTLTPTYTPGVGETGNVVFTLTATGNGSCVSVQDQMTLVVTPAPVLTAGSDEETCQGATFNFTTQATPASASGYATITWTTTGTGILFNPNTFTPTYQPGTGEAGNVTFTLTATGNGSCVSVQDQMVLTITPSVIVSAGSDAETCEGAVYNFASQVTPATANNYSSVAWTTSGTGVLTNANTLTPTYTPGAGETGNVTFTLTATGNGSCTSVNDIMVLTVIPAVLVNAGSNDEICQGGTFPFSSRAIPATASHYSALQWTHNGSGTLFDGATLSPTYFSAPGETGVVTFTLTAFANGSCSSQNDFMEITIIPSPTVIAGSNDAVCEGMPTFDFATRSTIASISNGNLQWSHNGTGSLNDDTALNPVYTVGAGDVNNVITFTLTVTSPSSTCTVASSSFELRVNPEALVSVPATLVDVCEPDRINLAGSIGGSASGGSWSLINGDGTLSVSSITGLNVTATYTTDITDVGNILTFRLTTNDPDGTGPCASAFIDVDFNVEESAKVFAGNDFSICEYDDITLVGSFSGSATAVTWTGGTNNFDVATNPITGYTLNSAEREATNLFITFTLTTNDPPGVCPAVSDQVTVAVRDTLNFVTIIGLDPVYAENSPPVTMTGVPSGGTFSGPGVSGNTFFPSIANLTPTPNFIHYTYQDAATGCYSSPAVSVVVNPITNVNFRVHGELSDPLGLAQGYICANQGDVTLEEDPEIDIPGLPPPQSAIFLSDDIETQYNLPPGSIYFDGVSEKYKLRTNGLEPKVYRIRYEFTNEFSATTKVTRQIRVTASPTSVIDVDNSCIESIITFTESSTILGSNPFGATISTYQWQFGDGNGSTSQMPNYQYTSSNSYNVSLRVTTNEGCFHESQKIIRVGPVPNMAFNWTEFCSGNDTKFNDLTDAGISSIESYEWTFDDGFSVTGLAGGNVPPGTNGSRTLGTFANPAHRYDNFGQYNVALTVTTNDGCTNSLTRRVFIQDYGTPSPIAGYYEDFEASQGTWVRTRANNGLQIADLIVSDTSWLWGAPSGTVINTASNGSTNAWWTGGNTNTSLYNATYYHNEKSAVIGPCLNLTGIKRPMVSIDYWADLEDQRDGAVLQYSTDGGTNWQAIGNVSGAGINWYNAGALVSNPGLQPIGQYGWTGIQTGWKTARFNLDMIPATDRAEVIFRIAFGSNSDNGTPSRPYEGFAFDNIFIGEKQRNVLVEYFTNAGISSSTNDYLNNLYADQFTFKDSSDFFKIQYHIANPSPDVINQENPVDPAARSLYYGVSQPPAAIMDGILGNYFGTSFNGDQTKITAVELDRRTLEDPLFAIDVTQEPTTNDSINLIVNYEYITQQSVTTPYTFQVALIEGDVNGNVNVLRKMLLGSEGLTINTTWNNGTIQSIPVKSIVNVPIQDGNNLYLVAFVQDRNTKHIHQSRVVESVFKVSSTVVGIEDDPVLTQVKDIVVFPNPASNIVNFGVENRVGATLPVHGYTWSIIDQRGIEVLRGNLNEDLSEPQQVELDRLANGMYIITFSKGGRAVAQRKLVVMNRN